jgi:hypothetical protein
MLYRIFLLWLVCHGGQAMKVGMRRSASARGALSSLRMSEDPIGSPFIKAINQLQETLQQSPAAKFKAGEQGKAKGGVR